MGVCEKGSGRISSRSPFFAALVFSWLCGCHGQGIAADFSDGVFGHVSLQAFPLFIFGELLNHVFEWAQHLPLLGVHTVEDGRDGGRNASYPQTVTGILRTRGLLLFDPDFQAAVRVDGVAYDLAVFIDFLGGFPDLIAEPRNAAAAAVISTGVEQARHSFSVFFDQHPAEGVRVCQQARPGSVFLAEERLGTMLFHPCVGVIKHALFSSFQGLGMHEAPARVFLNMQSQHPRMGAGRKGRNDAQPCRPHREAQLAVLVFWFEDLIRKSPIPKLWPAGHDGIGVVVFGVEFNWIH